MKPRLFVLLFIAGLLLVLGVIAAACGDGEEEAGITFEVSFDGDRCQYKGPEAIGEGEEVVIVLNNLTDSSAVHFHVVKLDEGKTLQDLVEYVGDAIDKGPPPWVSEIFLSGLVEGKPVSVAKKYLFEPGSYAIGCAEHLTFPIRIAAPLIEVRPNSSE